MLAPLLFVSGVASCLASGIMGLKESNDIEVQYEQDLAAGYSYAAQSRYDFDQGRLYKQFYIGDIMNDIKKDYPKMNDFVAREIAEAAIAKKLLEEETNYKYKPLDKFKYFDLKKYGDNAVRKTNEEEWYKQWENL